ncbi:uncharacterized protein LOC143892630 isoform X2 [Tasmannia lanceolata]|uniref:uncharacterized protein LOC143892630 isoform X2 n=1 Tax=Tasmannia lanceolata TaxID=3420 RepID=UPI0040632CE0
MQNSGEMTEFSISSSKNDTFSEHGWTDFSEYQIPSSVFEEEWATFVAPLGFTSVETNSRSLDHSISSTVGNIVMEEKATNPVLVEKIASSVRKESSKKRRADMAQQPKPTVVEDGCIHKRMKGDAQEAESKETEQNNNNNRETSLDTLKNLEDKKPAFIHVRARRGQATDSHSLAERVRRQKISERMKYLQDLVPGCNEITGKAGMIDQIINYVQSLQRQVESLSMKLSTVNPSLDFNIDNFFEKEMFPAACNGNFPATEMSSELVNPANPQFNPVQQVVACCGMDMAINPKEMAVRRTTSAPVVACCGMDMVINPHDMALRRTTSAPVSVPETFTDSYFHAHGSSSNWDLDLQTLYNEFYQARQLGS